MTIQAKLLSVNAVERITWRSALGPRLVSDRGAVRVDPPSAKIDDTAYITRTGRFPDNPIDR